MSQTLPIVVVEDSAPNRKILCHILEKLGCKVLAFEDGALAWEFLKKEPHQLCGIISDLMMPNLDGMALLKNIREHSHYKDLPFLLLTAVLDKEFVEQAKQLNAQGYMLKPVTFGKVTEVLRKIIPNFTAPKVAAG